MVGDVLLNLLQMFAVPLIVTSVISGKLNMNLDTHLFWILCVNVAQTHHLFLVTKTCPKMKIS